MDDMVYWSYWYALNKEELEYNCGFPNKIRNAYTSGPIFVWLFKFGMPYVTSEKTNAFIEKYGSNIIKGKIK